MTWHGQINRTIWEIETQLEKDPNSYRLRRQLLRTHFLQRYEYDRTLHIPRDDRTFLFLQDRQAPAILLFHGAAGTPAEMRDLGSYLYGKGYTVYCPRLSRFDVKNRMVTWEAWVTAAENALTTVLQYSKRTMVVGLSFGGTIALTLNELHPVHALVLLAPAIHTRMGLKNRLLRLARYITPTLFFRFAGWNGEIIKAMDNARKNTGEIKPPTLAIQASDDHLVSPKGLKFLQKRLKHEKSETILLKKGSHALTRGDEKDTIFEKVFEFAQAVQMEPGRGGRRGTSRRGGRRQRQDEAGAPAVVGVGAGAVPTSGLDEEERPKRRSRGRRGGRRARERREARAAREGQTRDEPRGDASKDGERREPRSGQGRGRREQRPERSRSTTGSRERSESPAAESEPQARESRRRPEPRMSEPAPTPEPEPRMSEPSPTPEPEPRMSEPSPKPEPEIQASEPSPPSPKPEPEPRYDRSREPRVRRAGPAPTPEQSGPRPRLISEGDAREEDDDGSKTQSENAESRPKPRRVDDEEHDGERRDPDLPADDES